MHGDGAEGQTVAFRTNFRNRFDFCVEDASYDLPVNFSDTVRLRNKIRVAGVPEDAPSHLEHTGSERRRESLHLWREYLWDVLFGAGSESLLFAGKEDRVYSSSVASPKEKKRYFSCTAMLYIRSASSRPMKAETSISSVDSGR